MNKNWKILSFAIVLLVLTSGCLNIPRKDYSKGELKLEISLDKEVLKMKINEKIYQRLNKTVNITETFNITTRLSNVGDADVKILPFEYLTTFSVEFYDSQGKRMIFFIWSWWIDIRPPFTNDDLYILRSKESIEGQSEIYLSEFETNYTMRPDIYTMRMIYYTPSDEKRIEKITTPFWKGSLISNNITFKIVGDER